MPYSMTTRENIISLVAIIGWMLLLLAIIFMLNQQIVLRFIIENLIPELTTNVASIL